MSISTSLGDFYEDDFDFVTRHNKIPQITVTKRQEETPLGVGGTPSKDVKDGANFLDGGAPIIKLASNIPIGAARTIGEGLIPNKGATVEDLKKEELMQELIEPLGSTAER